MIIAINKLTQWRHLPWAKIYSNIFRLQKYIYQASKECNKYRLNKLQKYLLESSDAKIVAIQKVLNYTHSSGLDCKHRNYYFNDKDKFFIYKTLYGTLIIDSEIYDIVKQIKQYILCMCIQPELSAKSTRFSKGKINFLKNLQINNINYKKNTYINQIFTDLNINYVLNHQYQALPYITKGLANTLAFNNLQNKHNINNDLINQNIYQLKVILLNLPWFSFDMSEKV